MQHMARLNEPLQPAAESIDVLKRRFVRQNREIARANSTQSVRIRNLECEVSRLLGENVSLREQIIKLHYEAEKNTSKAMLESVDTVKGKLEAKLLELGGLVRELGEVEKTVESQRVRRRKSINRSSPKRSPDQRNWKNTLSLSEAVGGADGRLPPIAEDKYYPRRTMEAEELLGMFIDPANITDSPDLGPPPVAHFEEGDPIKFDPGQEQQSRQATATKTGEAQPKLSANLETRKKRRESSHHRDPEENRLSAESTRWSSSMEGGSMNPSLKSGAKRKLNIREENDTSDAIGNPDKEGFQSNRRNTDLRKSENGLSKPTISKTCKPVNANAAPAIPSDIQIEKEKPTEVNTAGTTKIRKPLGPKSVNSDPTNSPLKMSKFNSKNDRIVEAKNDLARIVRDQNRSKDRSKSKAVGHSKDKEVAPAPMTATAVVKPVEPPPETPAPALDDLFSPGSSEPSAARADLLDTPPPPDLGPDTGTGSFGRASRRPRGAVSYAQPNLRDKMRRPTADLVDAVGAERARQASIAWAERETSNSVTIKQEEVIDAMPLWKTNEPKDCHINREEPTSPLGNKSGMTSKDLPSSVITERRRRTIIVVPTDDESDRVNASSGAASAIAALTAGSHKLKKNEEEKLSTEKTGPVHLAEPEERPSVYDFTGSSPPADADKDAENKEEVAKPSRSSRRHSTLPAAPEPGKGSLSIFRRGERRKDTILDGRRDNDTGQGINAPVARTKSVLELGNSIEDVSAMGRGERAASRRRSMML